MVTNLEEQTREMLLSGEEEIELGRKLANYKQGFNDLVRKYGLEAREVKSRAYEVFKETVNEAREKLKFSDRLKLDEIVEGVDDIVSEFVKKNKGLVYGLALNFSENSGEQHPNFDDMISEGNLALSNMAYNFDYKRDCKFSTLTTVVIRNRLSLLQKRCKNKRGLYFTDLNEPNYRQNFEKSLQAPINEPEMELAEAKKYMSHLSDRERSLLCLKFGIEESDNDHGLRNLSLDEIMRKAGVDETRAEEIQQGNCMTLEELGKVFGVSKERARQIKQEALGKLRRLISEQI